MELIQRREASTRLRDVVDIPDGLSAQLILDHQIRWLTKQKRDALTARSNIFGSSSNVLLIDADNVRT